MGQQSEMLGLGEELWPRFHTLISFLYQKPLSNNGMEGTKSFLHGYVKGQAD